MWSGTVFPRPVRTLKYSSIPAAIVHYVASMHILRIKRQFFVLFNCPSEPSEEHKEIADSHTLVDKVSCGSARLTECGSPARRTRSHRIAPEVWIRMCKSI